MNTHPFEVIERLIDVELRKRSYTPEELDPFIKKLYIECNRILQDECYGYIGTDLSNKVKLTQHSLLRVMDLVTGYLSLEAYQELEKVNPVFELQDVCKAIFNFLRICLSHMLWSFKKYMDIDYQIPPFYFEIDKNRLKADLSLIRDKLSDIGIDAGYWSIFRQAFGILFSADVNSRISYRQLSYLMELSERLKVFLSDYDESRENLASYLIYFNFNCPDYVMYFKELINKDIHTISATKEKLMKLYDWRLEVRVVSLHRETYYLSAQPSLKMQIDEFIDEKIAQLENEPAQLTLSDLHPETAKLIRMASKMQMSAKQLKRFVEIVVNKDFYKQHKKEVDYLFSTFCKTVPEDNPLADKALSIFKLITMVNKIKSRLWL